MGGVLPVSNPGVRATPYGQSATALHAQLSAQYLATQQKQLPPGWDSATDPKTSKLYYFNRTTNEITWHLPPASLPLGWEKSTDPVSTRIFYFNRATNQTRWDPPPS